MTLSSSHPESHSDPAGTAPLARPAPSVVAEVEDEKLTPAQAARLGGVSLSTVYRRVEAGLLPAEGEGRGMRISKRTILEIGPLKRREPKADRASARGELARVLFPLLDAGTPLDLCCVQLAADPSEVKKLFVDWMALRELSARYLAPPATPAGPTFNHAPNDTWTCCPGHEAMKRMEKR